MTTKTIYFCDRCPAQSEVEEDFAAKGWLALYMILRGIPQTGASPYQVLCPSCSTRALEKTTPHGCVASTCSNCGDRIWISDTYIAVQMYSPEPLLCLKCAHK